LSCQRYDVVQLFQLPRQRTNHVRSLYHHANYTTSHHEREVSDWAERSLRFSLKPLLLARRAWPLAACGQSAPLVPEDLHTSAISHFPLYPFICGWITGTFHSLCNKRLAEPTMSFSEILTLCVYLFKPALEAPTLAIVPSERPLPAIRSRRTT